MWGEFYFPRIQKTWQRRLHWNKWTPSTVQQKTGQLSADGQEEKRLALEFHLQQVKTLVVHMKSSRIEKRLFSNVGFVLKKDCKMRNKWSRRSQKIIPLKKKKKQIIKVRCLQCWIPYCFPLFLNALDQSVFISSFKFVKGKIDKQWKYCID